MIAQNALRGLNTHILQAACIQNIPRHLRPRQTLPQRAAETLRDDDTSRIVLLTVIEPVPGYIGMAESIPGIQMQATEKTIADLKEMAGENDEIDVKVLHGHAAKEINSYAEKIGADCIIVASHKPEFSDYFIGSTAARVVRHAPCTVLVMR